MPVSLSLNGGLVMEIGPMIMPTSPTIVASSSCRILGCQIINDTAVDAAISIYDRQDQLRDNPATPCAYFSPYTVLGSGSMVDDDDGVRTMPGGITWSADVTGVVGFLKVQLLGGPVTV